MKVDIKCLSIPPNLVQPHHFAQLKCLKPVYRRELQVYLRKVREWRNECHPKNGHVETLGGPYTLIKSVASKSGALFHFRNFSGNMR